MKGAADRQHEHTEKSIPASLETIAPNVAATKTAIISQM
jgi:hypothetical protein